MEKVLDNNYYDLMINNVSIPMYDTGNNITTLNFRHSLAHVLKTNSDPCNLGVYPYHSFPTLYVPTSTISIEKSGIGTVQRNPFLGLFGQGIIVGVIDTGIDYQHQAFLYNDGTTRILSIWDQSIQNGPIPEGFTFGTEYRKEIINLALKSDNPLSIVPSVDTNGHGTSIASVIAGKPNAEGTFSGIVPESELVVVKLKDAKQNLKEIFFVPNDTVCFQESDIILGIRYLISFAQSVSRPVVICIALGSSSGGHDGSGALSNYLNYLGRLPGIGLSVSAGNEGNNRRHYFNNTKEPPFYNDFELRVGERDKMFSMEIWPYALGRFAVDISTPNRESTQLIYPTIGSCRMFNFIFTPSVLWVNNFIFEEETGDQLILLRFRDALPGVWSIRIQSIDNEPISFHSWLPSGDLLSNETFFLNPNPDTTITSPGNGLHQLTVTAYNQFNDSILLESSRGYTRSGQVKPDIAAPGYELPCALPRNQYGSITGTGAAAAHTAGAIAMILEWGISRGNYTSMTGYDINRLIIRGARREGANVFPNNIWGYGQLDVNNLFRRLTNV
ncbi:S8 family peptidase [Lacrimispora sphenoides]|uniref:Subtilase family protein n=1 Tax=Lacrimispora sphenoides JCM 1415 TaxID=1297793 RepID=A0ABY1C4R7_9FIRM|nr:S8 family peptidase [Lacrimispora sphenoides]SET65224.1 Subtilase family protein [[Clostridium] sphenoides JCM 1415]SUY50279.1 peptidase S8 and S53 subtilisin kexin sedolisin [Lacrimispora sphenoides]